jgi:hypothetical protein
MRSPGSSLTRPRELTPTASTGLATTELSFLFPPRVPLNKETVICWALAAFPRLGLLRKVLIEAQHAGDAQGALRLLASLTTAFLLTPIEAKVASFPRGAHRPV